MTWIGKNGERMPELGDAFLIPLGKGAFTFCWVAGHAQRASRISKGKVFESDVVILACARWIGRAPPTAADLEAPEVLEVTFDGRPRPLVMMCEAAPPKKLRAVGKVVRPEIRAEPDGYGGWWWMEHGARAQRAWNADPTAEAARRDAKERARLARNATTAAVARKVQAQKEARLAWRSIAAWARAPDLLAELRGAMPKRRVDELTAIVRGAARALARLPAQAPRRAKVAVIEQAVHAINEWNARVGPGVIETAERELLCEAIDRIGRAAGLRGHGFAEASRDW